MMLLPILHYRESNMLNDLFRSGAAWRCRPLQQSPFHRELEEFADWLKAAHYTTVILRRHLGRLDRTLRRMPGAAPGATYSVAQLQTAFGKWNRNATKHSAYCAGYFGK